MFVISIAGINIGIDNRYPFVKQHCRDFITDAEPEFCVSVTDGQIERERACSEHSFDNGYLESVCIYRDIAMQLPSYDAFLMHAAVVRFEDNAYAFSAKSGTGKTTHIKLWRRTLGEGLTVINGDKPVLRYFDGKLFACGTPWGGKEGLYSNSMAPLKSICFIARGADNRIERLSAAQALGLVAHQILIPKDKDCAGKTLDMISRMIGEIPIYRLYCNISEEAARLSYDTMSKGLQ